MDTVTYGMPPDGYETITIPEEVGKQLDDHAQALGAKNRVEAIRTLIMDYEPGISARVVDIEEDVLDDIANWVAIETGNELQDRFR